MIEIPLGSNQVTTIDDQDFPLLSKYKWKAIEHRPGKYYVYSSVKVPEKGYRNLYMHRLIMNPPDELDIDHKDGNGLNNCRSNLRLATTSQNSQNQRIKCNNTSGYKGVSYNKKTGKWEAYIQVNGRKKYLGLFVSKEGAAKRYDNEAKKNFGEFALLNFGE